MASEISQEIQEINAQVDRFKNSPWGFRRRRVSSLKIREFKLLKEHLLKTDSEFKEKHFENMKLLKNEELIFTVSGTNRDQYSSHAFQLDGLILKNGVLSLQTSETDTMLIRFGNGTYPEEFEGIIDSLGRVKLQLSKSNYQVFGGRVPSKFKGFIDESGLVRLRMIESEFEFTGNNLITHLICTPFRKSPTEKEVFLANKRILTRKVKLLREELLSIKLKD